MEDPNNKKNQKEFSISLPEGLEGGVYSNFVIVGHTPSEFILDFVQILPGTSEGKVRSRVIMSPIHAKRLLAALSDNVQKFENTFGNIDLPDNGNNSFPGGFSGGPAGFA